MIKGPHKIKDLVKSTPVIGRLVTNMYRKFMFIKPGGQYWQYDFKAIQFDRLIRRIVSMIGDKEYRVVVSSDGKAQVILKNGIKFWWIARDPYSLLGMSLRGNFEPECTALVTKLVKRGDIVFDIGANFGWYSCHLAQLVGEVGRVHIFEPTNAIEELKNNLILNRFESRCTLNQFALGEKGGTEILYIPQKLGTAFASLREHSYGNGDNRISVPVKKVEDYVLENKIKTIDFIKIDVEGAEYLVLKGAKKVLQNYSPIIIMEIQEAHTKYFKYSPEELISYLKDLGYQLYEIDEKEFCFVRKVISFSNTRYYNFLAVRNDSILKTRGISIK